MHSEAADTDEESDTDGHANEPPAQAKASPVHTVKGATTEFSETDCQQWIEECLGITLEGALSESLRSGVVLCDLVNWMRPDTIAKVERAAKKLPAAEAAAHRDNIHSFIDALPVLEVGSQHSFEVADLFEGRNVKKVVRCVEALSKLSVSIRAREAAEAEAKQAAEKVAEEERVAAEAAAKLAKEAEEVAQAEAQAASEARAQVARTESQLQASEAAWAGERALLEAEIVQLKAAEAQHESHAVDWATERDSLRAEIAQLKMLRNAPRCDRRALSSCEIEKVVMEESERLLLLDMEAFRKAHRDEMAETNRHHANQLELLDKEKSAKIAVRIS